MNSTEMEGKQLLNVMLLSNTILDPPDDAQYEVFQVEFCISN